MIASKSPEAWTHFCVARNKEQVLFFHDECDNCRLQRPEVLTISATWKHVCTGLGPLGHPLTLSGPNCPHCDVLRPAAVASWSEANIPTAADVPPAAERAVVIVPAESALTRQEGGDHYKKMKIQPAKYGHANGLGGLEFNVVKYVSRWKLKGGIGDLKKARHCLDLLIEFESQVTT